MQGVRTMKFASFKEDKVLQEEINLIKVDTNKLAAMFTKVLHKVIFEFFY